MAGPDLNLLIALDVLLDEGNVARAARRLGLSPSAMSRTLARLRKTMGDPLLVRSGRGLVATPRAIELREEVGVVVDRARAVLRAADRLDLATVNRTFTLRTSDGFVESFGAALLDRVARDAPGVLLRFVQKVDKDSSSLRTGVVDLETGVVEQTTAPELRTQALFRDHYIGCVRSGHPILQEDITTASYGRCSHVLVSRKGEEQNFLVDVLGELGIVRNIGAIVSGFAAAIAIARGSELVASIPARHTEELRHGVQSFALPFALGEFTVSMLWHPRLDADPAHRWLRSCLREVCAVTASSCAQF